jgi:beta-1,4-mannosyl-glycoprotein beta-1,4-N-acetylglucosaminyltransferase
MIKETLIKDFQIKKKIRIYDCFMFFNEFDILDIRLNYLSEIVDHFVIIDYFITHQKNKKNLNLLNNMEKFDKFYDKIIYVVPEYQEFPNFVHQRPKLTLSVVEVYERNSMLLGLKNCNAYDLVLISDIDEIPKLSDIEKINGNKIYGFHNDNYISWLNNRTSINNWNGTQGTRYDNILSPQITRATRCKKSKGEPDFIQLQNAGWHWTSCYGTNISSAIKKYNEWGHAYDDWTIKIKENIVDYKNDVVEYVDVIKTDFPDIIKNNILQYEHLIYPDLYLYKSINGTEDFIKLFDSIIKISQDNFKMVEVGPVNGKTSCYLAPRLKTKLINFRIDIIVDNIFSHDTINSALRNSYCRKDVGLIYHNKNLAYHIYDDNSLDFVFLHSIENINEWMKKIKPGGQLAGYMNNTIWNKINE